MREEEITITSEEAETLKDFLVVEAVEAPRPAGAPKKRLQDLIAEKKAARLGRGEMKSKYIAAIKRVVYGSAAEVERLWSMAGKVLTKDRASMSPLVFESIMYLKYNAGMWNLADVVDANKRRKNEATLERQKRDRVRAQRIEIDSWETVLE